MGLDERTYCDCFCVLMASKLTIVSGSFMSWVLPSSAAGVFLYSTQCVVLENFSNVTTLFWPPDLCACCSFSLHHSSFSFFFFFFGLTNSIHLVNLSLNIPFKECFYDYLPQGRIFLFHKNLFFCCQSILF